MILNRPAIDWLTLTTYDRLVQMRTARLFAALLPTWQEQGVKGRMLQYEGLRGEGWFIGAGSQRSKDHYLFRFSGDLADAVTWQQPRPPIDCTRLDLQVTVPLPLPLSDTYASYKTLIDVSDESEQERGQKRRNIDAVVSPDGYCTLYVGSRESERFYRLYVKESGGEHFLRFEVEFKGSQSLAGRIWRDTAREPGRVVTWLKGELDSLPDHPLTVPLKEALTGVPGEVMKRERKRSDPNTTLEWLRRQVSPSIKRLIGNEDTRDAAMFLLMDWLKFAADQGELITE